MKIVFFLLSVLVISCSKQTNSIPTEKEQIKKTKTIDVLENGNKNFTYIYNEQDLPIESVLYNIETNKIESTCKYNYQDEKFNHISQNNIKDDDYTQSVLNYLYQAKFLYKKGIKIEHPEIISGEVSDLATILKVGENYDNFKKDSVVNRNEKTIIYKSFNKKIRFYPSCITLFIPEGETIKDYNLIIKDSLPIKETFLFGNNQSLQREYFYDENEIKKIVYTSSNSKEKLQREFIYKNQ